MGQAVHRLESAGAPGRHIRLSLSSDGRWSCIVPRSQTRVPRGSRLEVGEATTDGQSPHLRLAMSRCPELRPAVELLLRGLGMRYGQASYSGWGEDTDEERHLRYWVFSLDKRPLDTIPGAPLSDFLFRPSRNV
jgi:hypothetical protein